VLPQQRFDAAEHLIGIEQRREIGECTNLRHAADTS
jgi:hypothetical protein